MDTRSRISDVPISGKPRKRSTGIVGLNLLLDGGYPEGTIIMLYGTPTSGLDVAAHQFWRVEGEEGTYLMNDGEVETGMIDATEQHPEMYLSQLAGGRIVVDSLSVVIMKYGIEEALRFLRLTREEIKRRGGNMLFIVYTGIHTPMEMTRLMRAADIVIEFTSHVSQNDVERQICVHKVKGHPVPSRMIPFNIEEGGIEASTTSRVV